MPRSPPFAPPALKEVLFGGRGPSLMEADWELGGEAAARVSPCLDGCVP